MLIVCEDEHINMKKIIFFVCGLGLSVGQTAAFAACLSTLKTSAPNSRYEVQANTSQIKDVQSQLIWQRCAVGQTWNGSHCTGTEKSLTWAQALQEAKAQAGWRLPNIKELKSLVEVACYDPAINTSLFIGIAATQGYWTSSSVADDASNAWQVQFDDGMATFAAKTESAAILLVKNP